MEDSSRARIDDGLDQDPVQSGESFDGWTVIDGPSSSSGQPTGCDEEPSVAEPRRGATAREESAKCGAPARNGEQSRAQQDDEKTKVEGIAVTSGKSATKFRFWIVGECGPYRLGKIVVATGLWFVGLWFVGPCVLEDARWSEREFGAGCTLIGCRNVVHIEKLPSFDPFDVMYKFNISVDNAYREAPIGGDWTTSVSHPNIFDTFDSSAGHLTVLLPGGDLSDTRKVRMVVTRAFTGEVVLDVSTSANFSCLRPNGPLCGPLRCTMAWSLAPDVAGKVLIGDSRHDGEPIWRSKLPTLEELLKLLDDLDDEVEDDSFSEDDHFDHFLDKILDQDYEKDLSDRIIDEILEEEGIVTEDYEKDLSDEILDEILEEEGIVTEV